MLVNEIHSKTVLDHPTIKLTISSFLARDHFSVNVSSNRERGMRVKHQLCFLASNFFTSSITNSVGEKPYDRSEDLFWKRDFKQDKNSLSNKLKSRVGARESLK